MIRKLIVTLLFLIICIIGFAPNYNNNYILDKNIHLIFNDTLYFKYTVNYKDRYIGFTDLGKANDYINYKQLKTQ